MKITVELDDFYLDEEGNISEAFKESIISGVSRMVFSEVTYDQRNAIKAMAEKIAMEKAINAFGGIVKETIQNGEIPNSNKDLPWMKVSAYVLSCIQWKIGWDSITKVIHTVGEQISADMKKRVDENFALKIVQKLKDADMLKPGVAEALLEQSKQ